MTIAFFAVSGLDVVDSLDLISDKLRNEIINWMYRLQIVPKENELQCGGFQVRSF